MYFSPVPLLIIRTDVRSLIEVNGKQLGETAKAMHVALPVSDEGDYYISASPLDDDPEALRFPVTRRVRFLGGALAEEPADDVEACAWQGGVYELVIKPGRFERQSGAGFPYTVDTLSPVIGSQRYELTLYYENGLKLSVEENGSPRSGIALGFGESGTLGVETLGEKRFVAVHARLRNRERLILLDERMRTALDINGDIAFISGGFPTAIEQLNTFAGHERRVRYDLKEDGFFALPKETGFFSAYQRLPASDLERALTFFEAVREGFEAEAMAQLTHTLASGLTFPELTEFLGAFTAVRPPLSDMSGKLMGLIAAGKGRISSARIYELEFEEGLIANITEV